MTKAISEPPKGAGSIRLVETREDYLESIIESDLVSKSEAVSATPDLSAAPASALQVRPSPLAMLSEKSSCSDDSMDREKDEKQQTDRTLQANVSPIKPTDTIFEDQDAEE